MEQELEVNKSVEEGGNLNFKGKYTQKSSELVGDIFQLE